MSSLMVYTVPSAFLVFTVTGVPARSEEVAVLVHTVPSWVPALSVVTCVQPLGPVTVGVVELAVKNSSRVSPTWVPVGTVIVCTERLPLLLFLFTKLTESAYAV